MRLQTTSDPFDPKQEECLRLHTCWPWFLSLGVLLMLVGALAIGASYIATLTTLVVFGILLLTGGMVQIVNSFLARSWQGFLLHLMGGILHMVLGGLMIERPNRAAAVLTLMLAVAFIIGGLFHLIAALATRFSGSGWVALNGLVTLALGISIWRQWPEASYWVIGLFVGIDMIFNGWSWVMLALIVKSPPTSTPMERPAAG